MPGPVLGVMVNRDEQNRLFCPEEGAGVTQRCASLVSEGCMHMMPRAQRGDLESLGKCSGEIVVLKEE